MTVKKVLLIIGLNFLCLALFPKAVQASALYVRSNRSYVQPGESYSLIVSSDKSNGTPYTGYLDVKATACPAANPADCNTRNGPWGNYYVNNGLVVLPLPSNFAPGIFTMRLKPRNLNWDWSNEIKISVGTTLGLEDATAYWITPSTPVTYRGKNYLNNQDFISVIGSLPQGDTCGDPGKTWYFTKNKEEAYLNPKIPGSTWRTDANYLLYVIPWQKKPGWLDEYLWVKGYSEYTANFQSLAYGDNFKNEVGLAKFDSPNPSYPPYTYTPHWVGNGWGIVYNQEYTKTTPVNNQPFCTLAKNTTRTGLWAVHADVVNIQLPKYTGPALRYKYYEGDPNFLKDPAAAILREDWYFVKNVGLAVVEQKYFGTSHGWPSCLSDPDCMVNEQMANPNIREVRQEYAAPIPGDLTGDFYVNLADLQALLANFTGIFNYNLVIANYGR